ncbi:MAG TPA: hypothetical protein VGR96_16720 [Acidobacteriaceae bacterium]|nr:hypothetical protein [Acidobacteriaceae bacterium]
MPLFTDDVQFRLGRLTLRVGAGFLRSGLKENDLITGSVTGGSVNGP